MFKNKTVWYKFSVCMCVQIQGDSVSGLGWILYETKETIISQGKGKLRETIFVAHILLKFAGQIWHRKSPPVGAHSLLPWHALYLLSTPSLRNFIGESMVTSRWQTNYVQGMEERRDGPFSLHPLLQIHGASTVVNIYWSINELRLGRRFWKFCHLPHSVSADGWINRYT